MKILSAMVLTVSTMLASVASQATGGIISFHGALVKAPCETNANDLALYAANNSAYQAARKIQSGPSCSGMDNTLSVSKNRVVNEGGSADVISVAYN